MSSQKIPLLGGIITPVHTGNSATTPPVAPIPLTIFTPPDKALDPQGTQAFYELHLWIRPSIDPDANFKLSAYYDDDGDRVTVWESKIAKTASFILYGTSVKILDGYPVRGNVTLELEIETDNIAKLDLYPIGPQVYGYYYRVGQGDVIEPARRYIGADSPDGIAAGVPLLFTAANESRIIHKFENGRIDDLSLAFSQPDPDGADPGQQISLVFEDANDNPIIPDHNVIYSATPVPNFTRDPQSVYSIYRAALGGGVLYPQLDHLRATMGPAFLKPVSVHGYFTRY
jgi:hypothetical protein